MLYNFMCQCTLRVSDCHFGILSLHGIQHVHNKYALLDGLAPVVAILLASSICTFRSPIALGEGVRTRARTWRRASCSESSPDAACRRTSRTNGAWSVGQNEGICINQRRARGGARSASPCRQVLPQAKMFKHWFALMCYHIVSAVTRALCS